MTTTHTVRITNTTRSMGAGRALSIEGNDFTGGPGRSVRLRIADQAYVDIDLHTIQFDRDLLTSLGSWVASGLATVKVDGVNQTANEVIMLQYGLGGTSSSTTSLYVMKGEITVAADFPLPETDPSDPVQGGWAYLISAPTTVTDNDPSRTNTGLIFNKSIVIAWNSTGHTWMEIPNDLVAKMRAIHVNGSRTDFYSANGSESHPYKTIAAAVAVAVSGDVIVVAPSTAGPYAESVVLPAGVSLEGISGSYTYINGNLTLGTDPCSLKYVAFTGATNVLTINGGTTMRDAYSYGQITLPLATSKAQMWNCHVAATGKHAVILGHADAEFYSTMAKISTSGNFSAISSIGKVICEQVELSSNSAAANTINAITSGYLRLFHCSVVNAGASPAVSAANGATSTAPNVMHEVIVASAGGNALNVGTAVTHYDNVASLSGTCEGSGITTPVGQQFDSRQHTAASETLFAFRAMRPGYIAAANAETAVTAGAGETMTLDVRIAGVTSLTTPIPFAAGAPLANVPVPGTIDATKRTFAAGDLVTVVRVWGAGAAGLVDTVCSIDVRYF